MKISIITAVYNNKANMGGCIGSVASQTYSNKEHIIVDGASTDGTLSIIKEARNFNGRWVSEPDKGIYDALNKGISMATGDIIGILHSDDLFYSDRILEKVADIFVRTGCDAVYGDLLYVDREDVSKVVRYWKSSSFDVKNFRHGWMPAHPTLFLKREVYEQFGKFDLQFTISSDYDFMLRTVGSGKLRCEYMPEVVTRMRLGGASNKSLKNIWQKSMDDFHALRKNNMGGWYTLFMKNVTKVGQFFRK